MAWTASWSTCPRRSGWAPVSWPGACWTACASTPRSWAASASWRASSDLLSHGNGAARQVVVYEANHDLREVMAEIVAATGD